MAKKDCSEWSKIITQLVMNAGSREGVTNLDEAIAHVNSVTPDNFTLTRDAAVEAIVEATERGPAETTRTQSTINAIKAEARTEGKLRATIEELERLLVEGRAPMSPKKAAKHANKTLDTLRETQRRLRKELRDSDAVRIPILESQIAKLQEQVVDGNYIPKIKPDPSPVSKEVERLMFEKSELQRELRMKVAAMKRQTVWNSVVDKANITRGLMTTFDLSAVFRQGGFFVMANPGKALASIGPMLKAFASRKGEVAVMQEIESRDDYMWYRKGGIFFGDSQEGSMNQREEAHQSTLERYIPGMAASGRAYVAFLNKLRADMFTTLKRTLTADGEITIEQAKALGTFVNAATGRGSLRGLERAAPTLNAFFFSPRLLSSRFQLLGGAVTPGVFFGAKDKAVNRAIRTQYARYLIGMGAFYLFSWLAFDDDDDFDIEFDPRSSDFGKLRFGNTRLDPLSGLSQSIVLLSRLVTGETKSAQTHNVRKIRGTDMKWGAKDGWEITTDFMKNKLSPLAGTFVDVALRGRTYEGDPITAKHLLTRFKPLALAEVHETLMEQGLDRGAALSLMAILGMGIQTWGVSFENKSIEELQEEYKSHTYRSNRWIERQGTRVFVKKNSPHVGEEGRVEAIRKELQRRGKSI